MKKLYLVDVSSMFFRAFYAVRPLTSPSGLPVNAIYGFLSMVIKLIKQEKPEYMVFCYDRKEPSFRHELYDEYKAHRTEMPTELAQQMPYLKRIAGLLGIPSLEIPSFEADDLIGTLTHLGQRKKMEVFIVSGDKDFGQLIAPGVFLYDTMKEIKYDAAGVKEKWGVPPEQFIDYLALVGDSSDNIPGVKGIGPKGAVQLLSRFGDLESIYKNVDQIESKSLKEKLLASKENAFLSKRLVTIVTDCEVDPDIESYRVAGTKKEELRHFLQELNFKTLEKSLLGDEDIQIVAPAVEIRAEVKETPKAMEVTAKTAGEVAKWLKPNDEVWGFVSSQGICLGRGGELAQFQEDPQLLGKISDELNIKWKGFDLKSFWHRADPQHPNIAWDSMLAAYVLRAGDVSDLPKILREQLSVENPEFLSPEELYRHHLSLETQLKKQIAEKKAEKILEEMDLPLSPVLYQMEKKGIRIDTDLLKDQSAALEKEIYSLETEIHKVSGQTFNVASPKQLAVVLFEKMGLPAAKKTKTGYSTDNEVLEKLDHPVADLILQYRELAKLKSTYVDTLPQLVDDKGRIHTTFNQALTATGRLSSINPNLQNIPIRTERGQQVRKAFIAESGCQLLSVDYSQIELRILADITGDPGLIEAFEKDLDIHAATAAEIFSIPVNDVTPEHRRKAKAVNFGIAYGQGVFGLAETLRIPRAEAQQIIARYFERFQGVRQYIDSTIEQAEKDGFVTTLFGRRRYLPELQSKNQALKKFGERAAINAPIQGTASDIVKKAMIEISRQSSHLNMLLQVHDELIFEGKDVDIEMEVAAIEKTMESAAELKVPLKVNAGVGRNWDEAH